MSRAFFGLRVLIASAGVGSALGCEAYDTHQDVPVDCTITDAYDLVTVRDFDQAIQGDFFYTASDAFSGVTGSIKYKVADVPGGRCGSNKAAELFSADTNDWGALFIVASFGGLASNAGDYEGLSFWARTGPGSGKAFTVLLDDKNTSGDAGNNCVNYGGDGSMLPVGTAVDPSGNIVSSVTSPQPPANACGNSYHTLVVATPTWKFFTVPFASFFQDPKANRVPNTLLKEVGPLAGTALLTSQLRGLVFRMPRAEPMDLWLDDLAFYRPKAGVAAPPADGPH